MTHQLYRHYGEDGELLYVGRSLSAVHRLKQHARTAHWFDAIRRVEIDPYPTREAVKQAERELIKLLRPKFNLQHNNGLDWEIHYSGDDEGIMFPTLWSIGWHKTNVACTYIHLCNQGTWTFEGHDYSSGKRTWFDSCLTQEFETHREAYDAALDKLKPFFHLRRFVDLYLKQHRKFPAERETMFAKIDEWELEAEMMCGGGGQC